MVEKTESHHSRHREHPRLKHTDIHHLNVGVLRNFVNDRGKLSPASKYSHSVKLHRRLRQAVLRARFLALLPYSPKHRRTTTLEKVGAQSS